MHYPQFIFRGTEKKLWNPITKKDYKNRPEERVRLRIIEYLIEELKWSKNKISTEAPLKLPTDKGVSRTDVVCYDDRFEPYLLIECKAESIQINEQTALQIARYNSELKVPYLLITNGQHDYWFDCSNDAVTALSSCPFPEYVSTPGVSTNFQYWAKRGFVGSHSNSRVKKWLIEQCISLYKIQTTKNLVAYKEQPELPEELYLSGFYRYVLINQIPVLICISSTPSRTTYIHLLTQQSELMTLLISDEIENFQTHIYKNGKVIDITAHVHVEQLFEQPLLSTLPDLYELVTQFD